MERKFISISLYKKATTFTNELWFHDNAALGRLSVSRYTVKQQNTFYSHMKSYSLHLCFICTGFMMNALACDSIRGLSDRAAAFITKSDQTLFARHT